MKRSHVCFCVLALLVMTLFPDVAWATVESTLQNFGSKLSGTILPLVAILGLCYAGFSFITGSPNAKYHLIYAVIGMGIGLGAKAIVDMVRQLVQ
ncbi:MAG: TrbC/VirB2 family protein [Deltaproteobacteria bacterium]|nr:TrbC/VirB2 family protein [Deltaproteobacteria bacterium]